MIPGRFHAETFAPFVVPPGQTVTVPLIDQEGDPASSFVLPIGDTSFDTEISDVSLSPTATARPTRIILDPYRLKGPGAGDDDRTGRSVRGVVPPMHQHLPDVSVARASSGGTTSHVHGANVVVAGDATSGAPGTSTWADTFHKSEYVNADDGPFSLRISHNGTGPITVGKVVFRAGNQDAKTIYLLGGHSTYSDGAVR